MLPNTVLAAQTTLGKKPKHTISQISNATATILVPPITKSYVRQNADCEQIIIPHGIGLYN